jgi:hypothetical protein
MTVPTLDTLKEYLGNTHSWDDAELASALSAETAAQEAVCVVPESADYPDDLVEALYRRVAHNLALRALPLGIQAAFADSAVATNRVGGTDAEVRRLEGPYRKRIVG